jgi:hypothetical protein
VGFGILPQMSVPDFLTHYYEFSKGPFRNLSFLAVEQAESILQELRAAGGSFASQRSNDYLAIRRGLEEKVRSLFVNKGGRPRLARPHYNIEAQVWEDGPIRQFLGS